MIANTKSRYDNSTHVVLKKISNGKYQYDTSEANMIDHGILYKTYRGEHVIIHQDNQPPTYENIIIRFYDKKQDWKNFTKGMDDIKNEVRIQQQINKLETPQIQRYLDIAETLNSIYIIHEDHTDDTLQGWFNARINSQKANLLTLEDPSFGDILDEGIKQNLIDRKKITEKSFGKYATDSEKKWVLYQVAIGQKSQSDAGIVYTNLNQDNVFVCNGFHKYKLGHLTKARMLDDEFKGSGNIDVKFRSPEEKSQDNKKISNKTDVWAFGVLAYYLFFGYDLCEDYYTSYKKMEKKFDERDWFFSPQIEVDENLKKMIKKCLDLNPYVRPSIENGILNNPIFLEQKKKYTKNLHIHFVESTGGPCDNPDQQDKNVLKVLKGRYQYNFHEFLAIGSISYIFRCKDLNKPELPIVIKVISKDIFTKIDRENKKSGENLMQEVLNETKFYKESLKISNRHIEKYYDCFETSNNVYIVTEYYKGGSLRQKIDERFKELKYFKENEILEIMYQIVLALVTLAQKNVIHKDVKPKNIYLDKDICVLGGFRYADKLHNIKLMMTDSIFKAPEYTKQGFLTLAFDIWSLGCLVYEMVFGVTVPAQLDTSQNWVYCRDFKKSISGESISEEMNRILERCFELIWEKRITAKELKNDRIFDFCREKYDKYMDGDNFENDCKDFQPNLSKNSYFEKV